MIDFKKRYKELLALISIIVFVAVTMIGRATWIINGQKAELDILREYKIYADSTIKELQKDSIRIEQMARNITVYDILYR